MERAYGYLYDGANRLLQGDYVARTGTTGPWAEELQRYALRRVKYDENGNILGMQRRGLVQQPTRRLPAQYGWVDKLAYAYTANSNQLRGVQNTITTNQLPRTTGYNGAPTSLAGDFQELAGARAATNQDYAYDANGNLTKDQNKGITAIRYNYLNLPRQIQFGVGADSVVFRYTAAGQKVAKLVYQTGKPPVRTDYLGPYQYEADSLRFFPHAEGRVLRFVSTDLGGTSTVRYTREYTVKDHLGNLRLAYRAGQVRRDSAGLELGLTAQHRYETQAFDSASVSAPVAVLTPLARTGAYAARLNAGGSRPQPLGPLRQLAVQRGDTVRVLAYGLYPQPIQRNVLFSLASWLAGLFTPAPSVPVPRVEGYRRPNLPLLQVGLAAGLTSLPQLGGGVPRGYVRLLVFGKDSSLLSQQVQQLSTAARGGYEPLRLQAVVPQDGYVSAYVGNESDTDVFFDDVTIEHRQGLQVQENQYDPWGLSLVGLDYATPGIKGLNQYQFNGKERQNDLGLGWSDYGARFYDPARGPVWYGLDPLTEEMRRWSPYAFSFDNALRFLDPDGMKALDIYNIFSDGSVNVTRNNDRTDTFITHTYGGEVAGTYTMDKSVAKDGTPLVRFPDSGESFVQEGNNQKNFLRPDVAAAVLGAAQLYYELTGNMVQINQLTDKNGLHSGVVKPAAHGENADIRYANTRGNVIERVDTGSANFDKNTSQMLADVFRTFGFTDPNRGVFTERPNSTPTSHGPALERTHFPSNTFKKSGAHRFEHHSHMHLNRLTH